MLDWADIVRQSLNGEGITREQGRAILAVSNDNLPGLLQAAFEVRKAHFGRRVKICVLQNARSGLCTEDCHYCSQSAISTAPIEKYDMLSKEELLEGARRAFEAKARRYCMVTSGRQPDDCDIEHLCEATRAIKEKFPLEICVSVGMVSEEQARRLKESGVGWVNHNLNTSEQYHAQVCTTHSYEDRLNTIRNLKKAGLMTCSGGIVGMGETDEDVLDLAFSVRKISMDAIPVNFLHPIKGTPYESFNFLTPEKCLKILCLFRFLNPKSEIRAAGGREVNLRSFQAQALYPANSIFVEGYLTTSGQKAKEAHRMIEGMGFEVEGVDTLTAAT